MVEDVRTQLPLRARLLTQAVLISMSSSVQGQLYNIINSGMTSSFTGTAVTGNEVA